MKVRLFLTVFESLFFGLAPTKSSFFGLYVQVSWSARVVMTSLRPSVAAAPADQAGPEQRTTIRDLWVGRRISAVRVLEMSASVEPGRHGESHTN
jgi:hypothetical protein